MEKTLKSNKKKNIYVFKYFTEEHSIYINIELNWQLL